MTHDRRVVVTGVSGGIGSACAEAFRLEGWQVIGFDRTRPAASFAGTFVECDLNDPQQVAEACSAAADLGPLQALVNNAAVQVNESLATTSVEQWDLVMGVNVRGAFLCMRDLLPALEPARGSIVNVASVHAVATSQNISAYAASKGAMVALTRAAAVELAPVGIRCNAVLPGAVDTEMLRDGLSRRPHPDGPEGNLDELRTRTPLRTVASPAEIAQSVVFLADNERSAYTTGQSLIVDGGATARLSTE